MSDKPEPIRVGKRPRRVKHRIAPRRFVRPSPEPYHRLRGWRNVRGTYLGHFAVGDLRFPGEAWRHVSGLYGARVAQLPPEVADGPHAACFTPDLMRKGWWRVHFAERPVNLDAAILAVEATIKESLQ